LLLSDFLWFKSATMANITPNEIEAYCQNHTSPMPQVFLELAQITKAETTAPQMQVGHLEGKFLQFLVQLSQAKRVLELGTFTGYSSLAMAVALPADGKIITCDIDPKATQIAKNFWQKAGVEKKIELRLGPAADTIASLEDASFDLAFIDADKANYSLYWDLCLAKVRIGGLLVVDNVLWDGRILQPSDKSDFAICALNTLAKNDARTETLMLPIRDGILLARRLK